jgi:hypothetical protein
MMYNVEAFLIWHRHAARIYEESHAVFIDSLMFYIDRLCGLVVGVPGCRSRGPGFYSRRYQIFWEVVGLEQGPLSLWVQLRSYFKQNIAAPVSKTENTAVGIRRADHATPSIRKSSY